MIARHKASMKLGLERKILPGGVLTGGRGAAFVVEAASNGEYS